mmetsp:Transcript_36475/g.74107  ORF Transcript_36475/g.74107 Transcript_36475/m.74107 type:complete len:91 (-) Transcript_36475:66-338(-)
MKLRAVSSRAASEVVKEDALVAEMVSTAVLLHITPRHYAIPESRASLTGDQQKFRVKVQVGVRHEDGVQLYFTARRFSSWRRCHPKRCSL